MFEAIVRGNHSIELCSSQPKTTPIAMYGVHSTGYAVENCLSVRLSRSNILLKWLVISSQPDHTVILVLCESISVIKLRGVLRMKYTRVTGDWCWCRLSRSDKCSCNRRPEETHPERIQSLHNWSLMSLVTND